MQWRKEMAAYIQYTATTLALLRFTARSTHPYVELDVLVLYGFHIEAHGGNGCDGLVELELIEDSW